MTVFQAADFDNHREVRFFSDPECGLKAIIAVHWEGPNDVAGGGVRMKPYGDEEDALTDVLRLSRAMSYKFAMAGLPFGGGKTVVIGDSRSQKTPALLRALGRAVESFGGRYICGPDVGTTPEDMVHIGEATAHVRGRPGASGDTSPATGYGVYHAIRAAVRHKLNRGDLVNTKVAVQGVGAVGRALCRHLHDAGADIYVNDLAGDAVAEAVANYGATAVTSEEILALDVDVLAPCALGAVLNEATIPAIRAAIVCGGANNQLADARQGVVLADAGILYVPDYVANAGGAINATNEGPDYDEAEVLAATAKIYDTCIGIFQRADRDGVASSVAADRMAAEIVGR